MNRHILAVEDDAEALANLGDILELDGFHVTGAATLKQACERSNWSDFAVILLDRRLPDGMAEEVLPAIRDQAPRAAIIIITGNADLDGTIVALRAGATDYLLKPVNPDLLRAAVSRAIKLREMEDQVLRSERLAAIGQMMAVLTHESGNVLGRGNAYLEMLEAEVEGRPAALDLIGKVHKAHTDLRRLHEEVRNYAAPIELDCENWNLGTIWRQTWRTITTTSTLGKPPELVERISGVDLTCDCDGFRLDQVFRNLFENAVAACPAIARIEVACSAAELNGRPAIRVDVRDNGKGLTPAEAESVFAPFYTTKPKGTGLGLAIVARIVEAHGGTIAAHGRKDSGAEFTIVLPRRRPSSDHADAEPIQHTADSKQPTQTHAR
jgi:signal transduction histidine kinase